MANASIDEGQAFLNSSSSNRQLDVDDSQSLSVAPKCESYSNLYDQDLPLGGSAHSLRNQLVTGSGSLQQSPRPNRGGYSASPRAVRKAAGWQSGGPTAKGGMLPESNSPPPPYDYSSRVQDKPMTPRLGSPMGQSPHKQVSSRGLVLTNDEKYPVSRGSPSLTKAADNVSPVARTIPMSMPRYGSPTFPPSTARDETGHTVDVPLSVAAAGVQAVPGAVRRPMSFVRALEMSNQLTGAPSGRLGGTRQNPLTRADGIQEAVEEDDRAFGSSYEIAV